MTPPLPASVGSGSGVVYEGLRRDILRLTLAPGAELDEPTLCQRFAVSRTPVREALIRLAGDGLVVLRHRRGASVAPLDVLGLRDFFEALDIIQRAVTRLAALRRSEDDLARIRAPLLAFAAAAAAADSDGVNAANQAFHQAIARAARSGHLEAAYGRLLTESERVTYLCFSGDDPERLAAHLETTDAEHQAFHRAIAERDGEQAEAIAARHVELFRRRVLETIQASDAAPAAFPPPAARPG